MAEKNTKTTAPEKKESKTLNLAQKFVELRKACPEIVKKKHSDGVKYTFAKIFDVYELLAPAMNQWGVDWEIIKETPTRHHENGDAKYYDSYTQNTKNGLRTVWVYEADLTLRWINVDNPAETQEITLHALGTNDGGPDKAKGSAWTYCLKYYLFEKFNIDQGEDDPDMKDLSGDTVPLNGAGGKTTPPGTKNAQSGQNNALRTLSDKQLDRMYKKGEAAGLTADQINERVLKKYGKKDPREMTREQYDETCDALDAATKKNEEEKANA